MMSSSLTTLLTDENVRLLFNVSLKSAVLLGVAAVICRFLRSGSAAVRHRVWIVAMVVSLVLPIAVLILPQLSLAILPSRDVPPLEAPHVISTAISSPANEVETKTEGPAPARLVPRELQRPRARGMNGSQSIPVDQPGREVVGQMAVSLEPDAASRLPATVDAQSVLLCVWTIGVLFVVFPLAGLRLIQRFGHLRETPVHDPAWNASISYHAQQLGISRSVRTYSSKRDTVPAVYGVLCPYLVVPENFREWSDEMRRCVLLHELAHVKRRDVATQFLGQLAAALYWFNPLAWYALRQLRIERELACDDCVLLAGERASNYAQQLLNMLRMYRVERLASGVAMSHTARLDQRVMAVLDQSRCRIPVNRLWANFTGMTAILLVGLLGVVSIATKSATAETLEDSVTEKSSDPDNASPTADNNSNTVMEFSGVVLQGQKPVAGAKITLWQRIGPDGFYKNWHPREKLDAKPRQVAVSDENGNFEFTFSMNEMKDTPWNIWNSWIKPWHQVQVVVSKEGMGVGWCNLRQLQKRQKIWIRSTVPFSGKVVDLQGQPVGGCRVRFLSLRDGLHDHLMLWQPSWIGLSQDVVTDADGRFMMKGLPRNRKEVRLYVSGPSIATKIFSVDVGEKEGPPVEVIVEPTKPIAGVVRDRETGQPVSGVVVYGSEEKTYRLVRAITNGRGEYRLVGLPKSKQYQLTTYSPFSKGYLTRYTSAIDTPGLEPIGHDIPIRRGIPVHLTVIDKRTRKRLQPEVHYVPTNDNPLHREATRELYTPKDEYQRMHVADENGMVRFVAYPGRGLINVILQGAVYLSVGYTEEIKENEKTDITFGFSALSAAHGVIDPNHGDKVLDIELEADPGETQSARLIDEDGKPVVGATINNSYFNRFHNEHSIMQDENQPPGYASGLGSGLKQDTFEVYLLEPDKPRLLVFLHKEQKLIGLTTATSGEPLADVVMQRWGTVKGVVTDAAGKPLGNVLVKIDYLKRPANGFWPEQPAATTDASGRFEVERLIPGRDHKLTVEAPKGFTSPAPAEIKPEVGEIVDAGVIQLDRNVAE